MEILEPRPRPPRRPTWVTMVGSVVTIFFIGCSSYIAYQTNQNNNVRANVNVILRPNRINDSITINAEGNVEVLSIKKDQVEREDAVCGKTKDEERFECHPEPNPTEERCLARGCCWRATDVADPNAAVEKPRYVNDIIKVFSIGVPPCYYPPNYSGYRLTKFVDTDMGFLARLSRVTPSGFPLDVKEVQVVGSFMDENRLNIKISDPNAARYEVPFPKLNRTIQGRRYEETRKYQATVWADGKLVVTRKDTGKDIFKANLATMIFADQLLQLNVKMASQGFYGVEETQGDMLRGLGWKRYVMYNRDRPPGADLNLYGSHPFYLQNEDQTGENARSHGVLLFNSNAMDIVTQPSKGVTFRPIGGVFDFYIFMGPTPAQVVQQYLDLVGHSFLPPYWSLGFHLCRWGYDTLEETKNVWKRNKDAQIPFDAQWNDIEYMKNFDDFTVDTELFGDLGKFVDELHAANMRYVLIMDVGVGGAGHAEKYPPYDDGIEMDIFVKNSTGDVLIGQVWNTGTTVYPDFTHPKAVEYLTKQYQLLYDQVKFDGSWVDMNEPSNFVHGAVDGCPEDSTLEYPPYIPGNLEPLQIKTICMSAQHHASTHYNVHNLHGLTNAIATHDALKNIMKGRRPFVLTRASAPGVGTYAGHWTGDIFSTWENFRMTIPTTLTFGMLGVPMMGADICGFIGNASTELCTRWQALGAFYPFSRNHNIRNTTAQDPAAMGGKVLEVAKKYLTIRYSLLPFLYTLFYRSHAFGETVARPLFFEYPSDPKTYTIGNVFLWGPALMIIPVLEPLKTKVSAYIPNDTWYDFETGVELKERGKEVVFDAPLTKLNLLLRGGYIIPMQEPSMTTTESRKNEFQLIIALKDGKAQGELYWDEGDTLDTYENEAYTLIRFSAAGRTLKTVVERSGYTGTPMILGRIKILGTDGTTNKVTLNGKDLDSNMFELKEKELMITGLKLTLLNTFKLEW